MCLTSIVANKTSLQLGLPNEDLGSVAHTAPLLLPFPSFPSFPSCPTCPSNHQRSRSTARSGCASRTASCSLGQLGILDIPGDHWDPLGALGKSTGKSIGASGIPSRLRTAATYASSRRTTEVDGPRVTCSRHLSTSTRNQRSTSFNKHQAATVAVCMAAPVSWMMELKPLKPGFAPIFPTDPYSILTCVAVYVGVHMLEIEVAHPRPWG